MKEPRKDDERLSALLDGQVSGPERDELLTHLVASDDDYQVFNDAVEMLAALDEEGVPADPADEPATVIPLPQPRRPWRPPVHWVRLAAVLAGVMLVSTFALRGRTPAGDPVRLAAAVQLPDEGVSERLTAVPPWSGPRGGDALDETGPAAAARAGAAMVRLSVAVRARDTGATRTLANRVRAQFEPEAGGATPLQQIADDPGAPPGELTDLLNQATDGLADDLESRDYLELGAWAEAARLAATWSDAAFFRGAVNRKMLDRARQLTRDNPAARAALEQVDGALRAEGQPNWNALEPALNAFLRAIAS